MSHDFSLQLMLKFKMPRPDIDCTRFCMVRPNVFKSISKGSWKTSLKCNWNFTLLFPLKLKAHHNCLFVAWWVQAQKMESEDVQPTDNCKSCLCIDNGKTIRKFINGEHTERKTWWWLLCWSTNRNTMTNKLFNIVGEIRSKGAMSMQPVTNLLL